MIENNVTIDGYPIENLEPKSGKKVVRICDFCGYRQKLRWVDVYKSRVNYHKKYGEMKDRCKLCQVKSIRKDKIQLEGRLQHGGEYVQIIIDGKPMAYHRYLIEQQIGRKLLSSETVHHIDGNKRNNDILNLALLENEGQHLAIHRNLEKIALELVKKNVILFDKNLKRYLLNPDIDLNFMHKSLGFEDIAIKQEKNICYSRLDVDIKSEIIRDVVVDVPLIASNMSTVINSNFYIKICELGAFALLHRALSTDKYIEEVKRVSEKCKWVAASIGIGKDQYDLAKCLIDVGANILVIDIAHGYTDIAFDLCKSLKKDFQNIKLIIGSTISIQMAYDVADFADAIRVGIGQGFACETKNTAGCTEKQFSAVYKFKDICKKIGLPILSCGGVREGADFVKAIAAGASGVICGKVFAECEDSPAEICDHDGELCKIYAGMASEYVQKAWKGGLKLGTCAEGGVRLLRINNLGVRGLIEHYAGALKSGITYAGANNIKDFQEKVSFIRI